MYMPYDKITSKMFCLPPAYFFLVIPFRKGINSAGPGTSSQQKLFLNLTNCFSYLSFMTNNSLYL